MDKILLEELESESIKILPEDQKLFLELARVHNLHPPTLEEAYARNRAYKGAIKKYEKTLAERDAERDKIHALILKNADIEIELKKARIDVHKLECRIKDDRESLGAVTDIEERKDLKHDLKNAERKLNRAQARVQKLEKELSHTPHSDIDPTYDTAIEEAQNHIQKIKEKIEQEWKEAGQRVEEIRSELTDDILYAFDQQIQESGIPVAILSGRKCLACNIMLPHTFATTYAALDKNTVSHCPECRAYLIRSND